MKPMNKNTDCIKHKATVFVRVRPKLDALEPILNDLVIESQLPSSTTLVVVVPSDDGDEDHENYHQPNHTATAAPKIIQPHKEETFSALNGKLPINGFSGIFGMKENNKRVYQHSFQNKIETVMRGGTLSLFCYGYTGAGKTHTVLGYNGEAGLFQLAAEELLSRIDRFNSSEKMINQEPVILLASVIDVYNDDVYDLLGGNVKCTLRKNKMGQLSVRGPTRKHEFTEEEAKINGFSFSIVTTSLTTVEIKSIHDLEDIHKRVLQYRKVGTSSIHNKSSRSHAIFRLDIVNQSFLDTLSQVEEAESIKPAVQTAYDKKRTFALRHKVMELEEIIEKGQNLMDDMFNRKQLTEQEEGRRNSITSPFGGRLLLVDLAGADSDGRDIGSQGQTVEQRKESTAINKSLLALKECIRTLASSSLSTTSSSLNKGGGGSLSIPFRNSNLTRLLEEVLTPMPNRESCSVMLVNIGPEESLKPKTINSLRYGQMFSLSSTSTSASSKKNRTSASASSSRRPSSNLRTNRSKICK
jgi:hypothetical protein